jgi:hypothetical protein
MMASALFVPVYLAGSRLIWSSGFLSTSFLLVLYASVLTTLFSTLACYRSDRQGSLAQWRRTPYITGVIVLLALCLLPLATWPIALSGVSLHLHLRVVVLCLLGLNAVAAILVWFGTGWLRLGMMVVAYWVCFLWLFPLALRE